MRTQSFFRAQSLMQHLLRKHDGGPSVTTGADFNTQQGDK